MAMITADASLHSRTRHRGRWPGPSPREVLRVEAEQQARNRVHRDRLGVSIARAASLLLRCSGSVIVTGMGKIERAWSEQKLAGTLASTGTRAFTLHPAEAVHGDLGRIRSDDVDAGSFSHERGETEEVLGSCRRCVGSASC